MPLPEFAPQHAPKKCKLTLCRRMTRFSCDRCRQPVCKQHSMQLRDDGGRLCSKCKMAPPRA